MQARPVPSRVCLISGLALSLGLSAGCRTGSAPAAGADRTKAVSATTAAAASTTVSRPLPASPLPLAKDGWKPLWDGRTLAGWQITDFAGRGDVKVENGNLVLESGIMTGVNWTNAAALPRVNYEVALDAMRVEGSDFFCGLTFPVGPNPCSLIVGGWGGGVVGLSNIDSQDAANNDTTKYMNFDNGRWFAIRVRVTATNISAWIDGDRVVDADTEGRSISIRPEVEASQPLGIASWSTTAAIRNVRLRRL